MQTYSLQLPVRSLYSFVYWKAFGHLLQTVSGYFIPQAHDNGLNRLMTMVLWKANDQWPYNGLINGNNKLMSTLVEI